MVVKSIFFDLNGLFIISPKLSQRYYEKFGVKTEEFLVALDEIMHEARRPDARPIYQIFTPYLKKWDIKFSEKQFLEFWFNFEKEDKLMTSLVAKLSKKVKLFIVSNNFKERSSFYEKSFLFLSVGRIFTKVYYSWKVGYTKPDKRYFELILKENNLKAEECLYFDDSQKNVDVANGLGVKSYLFEGYDNLIFRLRENGLVQ